MQVLIVDDSRFIRQVIRNNLEKLGIFSGTIVEAMDGIDAMKKLAPIKELKLLVTDLQMPNMDGIEFLRRLRANRKMEGVRVVAISGNLTAQSVQTLTAMGVRDFVKKPFDIEKFMTTIKPVVQEIFGGPEEDESGVRIRSLVIEGFNKGEPRIALEEGNLLLTLGNNEFRITLDNFLKSAVCKLSPEEEA